MVNTATDKNAVSFAAQVNHVLVQPSSLPAEVTGLFGLGQYF